MRHGCRVQAGDSQYLSLRKARMVATCQVIDCEDLGVVGRARSSGWVKFL